MKRFTIIGMLLAILSLSLASASFAQPSESRLFWSNYGVNFAHIAVTKIVKGQNVFKSIGAALYTAAPAAVLHHQAMKMAGDGRGLIPAQLVAQKGSQIVRRSILGRPLISTDLLLENEMDFMFLNIRTRGLRPSLRVNMFTTIGLLAIGARDWLQEGEAHRFNFRKSVKTGAMYFDSRFEKALGANSGGNIMIQNPIAEGHEFVHYIQVERGNAPWDVLFGQDASQNWEPKWFRLDYGHIQNLITSVLRNDGRSKVEWEAHGYDDLR